MTTTSDHFLIEADMTNPENLSATQRVFLNVIMRPLINLEETDPILEDGSATSSLAEQLVTPSDKMTSLERLQIYNRQYWYRLVDSMFDDFQGLLALLGHKRFTRLVLAYLNENPSRSYTLRNLGSQLPSFIEQNDRYVKGRKRVSFEMARLEWAAICAFDEAELPALSLSELKHTDLTLTKLSLQPYISLLRLSYPLDLLLIEAKRSMRSKGEAAKEKLEISDVQETLQPPKNEPTFLAVHRFQNIVHYKRLTKASISLLEAIKYGASIEEACQKSLPLIAAEIEKIEDASGLIQRWFMEWSSLGWFTTTRRPLGS